MRNGVRKYETASLPVRAPDDGKVGFMEHKITFKLSETESVEITAVTGEKLLDIARKANVAIDAPCSGNGSCGKCRVKLLEGEVESRKTRHITDEEYAEGWRLACESKIADSDIVVEVPDIASAYRSRMKIADLSDTREIEIFNTTKTAIFGTGLETGTALKTVTVQLAEPTLDDAMSDIERLGMELEAQLGESVVPTHFALAKLPQTLREAAFNVTCLCERRNGALVLLDVWNAAEAHKICGAAIDIGTTTVAAVLVDLETNEIIAKASSGNGQIRYGADVINRIIEATRPGGIEKLQKAVIEETISPVLLNMCRSAGIPKTNIYRFCVAGNTTMNHLFTGVNPEFIRMEPYVPAFMEINGLFAQDMKLPAHPNAEVIIAPNIGSYVGGDITAGTLASMMWTSEEMALFIDLGTNGELVFGSADFMMSCACSAGPAFEGGDISCGMRATDGAIESCTIDKETYKPTLGVIGPEGQKPIGLCGSGLIDTVAEMFRCGIINPLGKISIEGERVREDEYGMKSYVVAFADESDTGREIALTETDLDNFIRAKGAIFSAVKTMLESLDFSVDIITKVIIAGGIGSGINIKNAIRIGMLPDIDTEFYSYIGNSSLSGAYAMLISDAAREKVTELARNMTYMELSSNPGYMDEFVAACFLPHTNAALFPSASEE
jgi:uncharacterized 2Fe-2S/4Fe-4S cluster protein (DUF4445 family)